MLYVKRVPSKYLNLFAGKCVALVLNLLEAVRPRADLAQSSCVV